MPSPTAPIRSATGLSSRFNAAARGLFVGAMVVGGVALGSKLLINANRSPCSTAPDSAECALAETQNAARYLARLEVRDTPAGRMLAYMNPIPRSVEAIKLAALDESKGCLDVVMDPSGMDRLRQVAPDAGRAVKMVVDSLRASPKSCVAPRA